MCCGCQTTQTSLVSRYMPDAEAQERIREVGDVTVDVGVFSAAAERFGIVECRARPITLPAARTIAGYIKNALETELSRAGKYDQTAPVVITGIVRHVELKIDGRIMTGSIGATWIIELELVSSNGQSFRVRSGSAYRTSFETMNCPEAARAFMPAVQKLIRTAVSHRKFPALVQM